MIASLYWVTQALSILFPGTGFFDPEFAADFPVVLGVRPNQAILSTVMLFLVVVAYRLESNQLRRALAADPEGRRLAS